MLNMVYSGNDQRMSVMMKPQIVRCANLIRCRPYQRPGSRRLASYSRTVHVRCRIFNDRSDLDPDTVEAVNEVSTRTLKILMKEDVQAAAILQKELTETRSYLLETKDFQSANFITVLQGLLEHEVVEEARSLKGPYLRAYNQLFNAIQNSNWKLHDDAQESASRVYERQTVEVEEQDFYRRLGVSSSSGQEDLKQAFRQLALQWHPDVNKDPKAEDKFIKIREAYDVLSDPKSRALYDKYGAEGMKDKSGAHSGDGNADRFWSEFKPFKKETRKTKARASGLERSMDEEEDGEPQSGDLVEYPLSDLVKSELQDGREKGVGLLVSRNKDRGDAKKLPIELLDLCEIEPLRQEEANSTRWIPDELGCSAFCDLSLLKKIPVKSYDNRFDVWEFETQLSEGCGGPEIVEEIIL